MRTKTKIRTIKMMMRKMKKSVVDRKSKRLRLKR
jgi:hypothetical protein